MNKQVRIWNSSDGTAEGILHIAPKIDNYITDLTYSPFTEEIFIASIDRSISVYNSSLELTKTLVGKSYKMDPHDDRQKSLQYFGEKMPIPPLHVPKQKRIAEKKDLLGR